MSFESWCLDNFFCLLNSHLRTCLFFLKVYNQEHQFITFAILYRFPSLFYFINLSHIQEEIDYSIFGFPYHLLKNEIKCFCNEYLLLCTPKSRFHYSEIPDHVDFGEIFPISSKLLKLIFLFHMVRLQTS